MFADVDFFSRTNIIIFVRLTGNDAIHFLTKTEQELRVDLTSFSGEKAYALYSTFKVANETSKYQLTVWGFSGTAGMSVPCDHLTFFILIFI
jgi:hypothetical protein